jgi:pimeloyl-ACP methyl ester carboxylesterase
MTTTRPRSGYFKTGHPFNRIGDGPRDLIVFQGLMFENKPQPIWFSRTYNFLSDRYTVYEVLRKPGMPAGYTIETMADDYAELIKEEFEAPIDIIGQSTGGSIAIAFAVRHPDLVRKLVIHSSAYKLSESARKLQKMVARQGSERNWVGAYANMMDYILPVKQPQRFLFQLVFPWISWSAGLFDHPRDASDLCVTVDAEDRFNYKTKLTDIKAPTLLAAGEKDPFYSPELFKDTAAGIPGAVLKLYPNMGHPASGRQFQTDVREFLSD